MMKERMEESFNGSMGKLRSECQVALDNNAKLQGEKDEWKMKCYELEGMLKKTRADAE